MSNRTHDEKRKNMLSHFFRTDKAEFIKCLEPSMKCENKAIRAHSVQNSRILENLIENGHVVTFKRKVNKDLGPQIDFGLIGRNKATTFTGLCSHHDRTIFSAIDNQEINLKNKKHLFLISYRSVHRELHATMAAASKIQSAYLQRVNLGLDSADHSSKAGTTAIAKMIVAWETWKYKTDYDKAFLNEDYDLICHDTFIIEITQPTIAVSALFSVEDIAFEDDVLRVVLNVMPVSQKKTVIIFSYRKREAEIARTALNRVLYSSGSYQLYEISRLILNSCENFVLAPQYVRDWPKKKKETIKDYFIKTILKSDNEFQSSDLYLF